MSSIDKDTLRNQPDLKEIAALARVQQLKKQLKKQ